MVGVVDPLPWDWFDPLPIGADSRNEKGKQSKGVADNFSGKTPEIFHDATLASGIAFEKGNAAFSQ